MKNFYYIKGNNTGSSLIEILIAIVIFFTIGSAIISVMLFSFNSLNRGGELTEANALAQEGIEAVRSIQERAWNENLYNQSGVGINNNIWEYLGEGTNETIGKYTRTIKYEDVCRDMNNDITGCPGTYTDMGSLKVTSTINWQNEYSAQNTVQRITYMTIWDSLNWFEDTTIDFLDGATNKTEINDTLGDGDGAVILKYDPLWHKVIEDYTYDCPGNMNAMAVWSVGDYLYIAQEQKLNSFSIVNPSSPVLLDEATIVVGGKVNNMDGSGNYLYLSTDANASELQVINITNPSDLVNIGSYNAPSSSDATEVIIRGNRAYMVTKNNTTGSPYSEFYIINITTPSSPVLANPNSQKDLGADANAVGVSGNYAFVATSKSNKELIVLNISNESNITEADYIDFPGSLILTDIEIEGNYAYVTTGGGVGRLYTVDISDPNNISILDYIEYPGNSFNRVDVLSKYAAIGGSLSTQEFVVVNVGDPGDLKPHMQYDYDDVINDVFVIPGIFFAASNSNTKELGVFSSSVGAYAYETLGDYISSAYDMSVNKNAVQLIKWSEDKSACAPACNILIQIRTAELQEDLPTAEWAGPEGKDGDETDFFTNSLGTLINTDHNGDQWIQYKAILSGDGMKTPILNNITINYK